MKITKEQQEKGTKIYQELVSKAWEDATFKDQLIQNPKATISSVTDLEFPNETRVVVEDQSDANTIYLNIPRKINAEDLELTDEQLEMVSGGDVIIALGIGFMAGVAFTAAAAGVAAALK